MKIKTPQELKEEMISEVLVRHKHQIEETQRRVLSFIASANDSEQYKRMTEDARFTFAVDTEEHAQIIAAALNHAGWLATGGFEDLSYRVRISHRLPQPRPEVRSREGKEEQTASKEPTITLRFETEEQRGAFLGWFLDGGGEYDLVANAAEDDEDCPNRTEWDRENGIISFSRVDE